jgi:glycolate oxidase
MIETTERPQNAKSRIYEQLASIVGSRYASMSEDVLFTYSEDFMTFELPGKADYVAIPNSTEEVQAIIRLANREKIPVTPMVANASIGSIATPREGGIVLDMRRMNRVIEVNEEDQYALVEAGITYAEIVGYMNKHHPALRIPVTYAPPTSGWIAACIMYGMTDLSMAYGDGSYFLNAMEAVLPTGEVIRTGSAMSSPYWNHHAGLPDFGLIGLFVGWNGSSGVITKASLKLFPKRPFRRDCIMDADTVERGFKIQRMIARKGIVDDVASNNWAWGRVEAGEKVPFSEGIRPGEAELSSWVSFTANTAKELEAKDEIVKQVTKEGGGKLTLFEDAVSTYTKGDQIKYFKYLPLQLSNDITGGRGGRAQWVGGYCPPSKNAEVYRAVEKVMDKNGYNADGHYIQAYNRLMDHGHEGIVRYNIFGRQHDTPKDVERHRACLKDIGATMRAQGVVLYKAPAYFARLNWLGSDPVAVNLIKQIKKLIDPNRIMNPGQLDL